MRGVAMRWYLNLVQDLQQIWDRFWFQGQRIDYYDYLASLLSGSDGMRTLKDIFYQDAVRYGTACLRGRLSDYWLAAYQRSGGDLYATWQSHFPGTEVAIIRVAQSLGNHALVTALAELSAVLRLLQDAARILGGTLWPAAMAIFAAMLISLVVPWFTLPRLIDTFAMVPPQYYGTVTLRLMAFASAIDNYYLALLGSVSGGIWLVVWSLPNFVGPVRRYLDQYLWWKVYRNVSALRFISFLRISLGDDAHSSIQLRSALWRQRMGAPAWLVSHIDKMLARIDHGVVGPDTFDTGLFTREQFWFLSDMILARGLSAGLALARDRIRTQILNTISRQAMVTRWCVLVGCVMYVLGLTLWHYAVIDEFRRALAFYFS